jgi:inorganic triphosphatase YgiF
MWERAGMSLQTELELKFRVDREIFKTALTLPLLRAGNDERASEALESVYFDTEDLDLMRRRIALRVRRANGDYVLGVKKGAQAHGSYFERDEEQAPSAGAVADLSLLKKATAAELKEIVGEKALAPRFVSDIQRTLRTVRFHGAEIEVALDEGFISAGEQREPAHEIELELKSGEPAALFEFGLSLVDALPLKLGILSKAQRGATVLGEAA